MEPQSAVSRKRRAPPVDPNNSEAVWLERIAECKRQRLTGTTLKNGTLSIPVMATVNKSRATSVEDIDDIDKSTHHANPKNPNTIIESWEDEYQETRVMAQKQRQFAEAAPKVFESCVSQGC